MEPRKTVVSLFLSSIDALLARDLNLPWTIETFAHEIIYLAQDTGIPFDYEFIWSAEGPRSVQLDDDLVPDDEQNDEPFVLRDDSLRWLGATYRMIRPPEGSDPFEFDRWVTAVCLAHHLRASGVPCTTLVSAILAEAPHLAPVAPEAVLRVC